MCTFIVYWIGVVHCTLYMNKNMIMYYDLDFTRHQLSDIILQYLTQIQKQKVHQVHDLMTKRQYGNGLPITKIDLDILQLVFTFKTHKF